MKETLLLILASFLGAIATFILRKYEVSSVVASCIVGIGGSLIGHYTKSPQLAFIIFAGSFVGMGDYKNFGGIYFVGIAGLLTGIIYQLTNHLFTNFGGRLGAIAFIGVVITYFISKIK